MSIINEHFIKDLKGRDIPLNCFIELVAKRSDNKYAIKSMINAANDILEGRPKICNVCNLETGDIFRFRGNNWKYLFNLRDYNSTIVAQLVDGIEYKVDSNCFYPYTKIYERLNIESNDKVGTKFDLDLPVTVLQKFYVSNDTLCGQERDPSSTEGYIQIPTAMCFINNRKSFMKNPIPHTWLTSTNPSINAESMVAIDSEGLLVNVHPGDKVFVHPIIELYPKTEVEFDDIDVYTKGKSDNYKLRDKGEQ